MRFRCVMRYYHPFPDVIPHTRAGCSRVTHPSATDQGPKSRHRSTWMCYARRQRSSWARIKLSNKLYILRFRGQILVWAIYSSFLYFFRVVFSLVLTDFCIRTCIFCFVLLSSVVQLSSFNRSCFRVSLSIISPLFILVKYFFKFSLKFFSRHFDDFSRCRFRGSFIILPLYSYFVKRFLKFFSICWLFQFNQFEGTVFVHI